MTEAQIDNAIARMEKLGRDESGWSVLYRNPGTMILFELFYPQSERHGGGPRELRPISHHEATGKYGTIERNAQN